MRLKKGESPQNLLLTVEQTTETIEVDAYDITSEMKIEKYMGNALGTLGDI